MPAPRPVTIQRFAGGAFAPFDDVITLETVVALTYEGPERPADTPVGSRNLWAWPNDTAPLALGQVLLDLLPAENCLHRKAVVEDSGELAHHVRVGGPLPGLPPAPPTRWDGAELLEAVRAFIAAEGRWDGTGCFHRAGVYDPVAGTLLHRAEDIGRHNCLDRLAGWSVLRGVPLSDKALLVSARMTASLCAKALRAGFRIIVSRSAVTTASVEMCLRHDATLVGFARTEENRFSVFTDTPGRLAPARG